MAEPKPWTPPGSNFRHHLGVLLLVYGFLFVVATAPTTVLNWAASLLSGHYTPSHLLDVMTLASVLAVLMCATGWYLVRSERERRRESHRLNPLIR